MKNNYVKESPLLTLISLGGGVNSSLHAGITDNYWIFKYGEENAYNVYGDARDLKDETFHGVAVDGDDNLYVVGTRKFRGGGTSNNFGIVLLKIDKEGAVQWEKSLDSDSLGNFHDIGFGITLDSSNNIYICGTVDATLRAGIEDAYVARYDSNGNFHWDAIIGQNSYDKDYVYRDVLVDSSGNIYLTGGEGITYLVKLPAGTGNNAPSQVTWAKWFYKSQEEGFSTKFDSSGNIYVWSVGYNSQFNGGCFLLKYNSSGTLSQVTRYTMPYNSQFGQSYWDYGFGTSFHSFSERWGGANHMAIDSQNNIYVTQVIRSNNLSNNSYHVFLLKLNSSGVIQWKKDFYHSTQNVYFPFVTVDSSDNVYIVFRADVNPTYSGYGIAFGACHIIKMNSSGTIQWHNVLHGDADGREKEPHAIISKGNNLYIVGRTKKDHVSQSLDAFIFKIPNDGSLTDTSTGKNGSTWGSNRGSTSISGYEFMYEPDTGTISIGNNFNSMVQDTSSFTYNSGNGTGDTYTYATNVGIPTPTINLPTHLMDFD